MMVGQVSMVLTAACQFGHGGVSGFTTNFIHSPHNGTTELGGEESGGRKEEEQERGI
jgi:hypothetical protein